MALPNPPITGEPDLDFILFEIIRQVNLLEQTHLKLIRDIRESSNFAELQTRIENE